MYAELGPLVAPVAAGESVVYHVPFDDDLIPLFQAPFTEVSFITPKDGVSINDLEPLIAFAAQLCNEEAKEGRHLHMNGQEHECLGATWGKVVDQDIIMYIGGWSSVEVSHRYIRRCPLKILTLIT